MGNRRPGVAFLTDLSEMVHRYGRRFTRRDHHMTVCPEASPTTAGRRWERFKTDMQNYGLAYQQTKDRAQVSTDSKLRWLLRLELTPDVYDFLDGVVRVWGRAGRSAVLYLDRPEIKGQRDGSFAYAGTYRQGKRLFVATGANSLLTFVNERPQHVVDQRRRDYRPVYDLSVDDLCLAWNVELAEVDAAFYASPNRPQQFPRGTQD